MMNAYGIRDNHHYGKVADFLTDKILPHSKLSVVSAYFTIYAYEALEKQLENIDLSSCAYQDDSHLLFP